MSAPSLGRASIAAPGITPDRGGREMRVVIRPYDLDFWELHGTRAQLEAEGVIPTKTDWPDGKQYLSWEDGCFRWSLGRIRPEGFKGPMKLWTSGDWWNLRCSLRNGPSPAARRILEKRRELANLIYRESAAGLREWDVYRGRYYAAGNDKAFHAFKTKIPGLILPKRGRKPKTATQEVRQ